MVAKFKVTRTPIAIFLIVFSFAMVPAFARSSAINNSPFGLQQKTKQEKRIGSEVRRLRKVMSQICGSKALPSELKAACRVRKPSSGSKHARRQVMHMLRERTMLLP
jgi:hypothetical protein